VLFDLFADLTSALAVASACFVAVVGTDFEVAAFVASLGNDCAPALNPNKAIANKMIFFIIKFLK
jgi:hypothetical protein